MGASQDARRAYLASTAVLSEAANDHGDKAISGRPNLYLYEAGAGFTFIGTLAAGEIPNSTRRLSPIHPFPFLRSARVSADGLHAAFVSTAPLTGYVNTDAESGEADGEVFLYDASPGGPGHLACISCDPSGARPSGRDISEEGTWAAGWIPGWQNELYPGRPLSENGNRVFFNSVGPLVPRDTNGRQDVYQWERAADKAQCLDQQGGERYVAASGGCLSLISSGQGGQDSEFVDADEDGSDVFLRTAESLVPQDPGLRDIYDARINGGFAQPPAPAPECEGDACQGAAAAPPAATPASAAFRGPGNLSEAPAPARRRCPKGKRRVSRHGKARCEKKRAKHRKKHAKHRKHKRQRRHDRRSSR